MLKKTENLILKMKTQILQMPRMLEGMTQLKMMNINIPLER